MLSALFFLAGAYQAALACIISFRGAAENHSAIDATAQAFAFLAAAFSSALFCAAGALLATGAPL